MTERGDLNISQIPFSPLNGVVRFDCMIDSDTNKLKIIELNSDYPDGLLLHDETVSVLSDTVSTKHKSFLKNFITFVANAEDYIFVLYPKDSTFLDAYYSELEFIRSIGYRCGIGTYDDLTYINGSYWHGPNKVSLIRRCTELYKLSDHFIKNTTTIFFNGLHTRVLGYKDLLLGDTDLILKTMVCSQAKIKELSIGKDRWVLKPTNLSEGKGVVIGADASQKDWDNRLKEVLSGDKYVFQEYLNPKKITIDYYDDDQIKTGEFYFDICPHFLIIGGKVTDMGHILVRFSKEKILNISKGGALGYGSFSAA